MEKEDQYIALNLQNVALERGMEEANIETQTDRLKMRELADKLKRDGRLSDIKAALSNDDYRAALEKEGYGSCPVCIAKTQYSMSDDPAKLGAPEGYELTIRSVRLSAGAGFVVAFAGSIIAMPGLPKAPAALKIDVDDNGQIVGLF